MERAKPYLQVVAVVSAVLLVGLFVAYRAGAFDRPAPAEPQAGETPSNAETQPPPHYMSGSKSLTFVFPPGQLAPPAGTVTPQPAPDRKLEFMLGSKSAPVIGTIPGLTPAGQPANTPEPAKPGN